MTIRKQIWKKTYRLKPGDHNADYWSFYLSRVDGEVYLDCVNNECRNSYRKCPEWKANYLNTLKGRQLDSINLDELQLCKGCSCSADCIHLVRGILETLIEEVKSPGHRERETGF